MRAEAADRDRAPFRTGLVIGLVIAGLASFAAFVALLGWGGDRAAPDAGAGRMAASPSAVGFKGLVNLTGNFARTQVARTDADLRGRGLLVIALDPADDPVALGRLLDQRSNRPTLVILPKWVTVQDPQRPSWVRAIGSNQRDASRLVGSGFGIRSVTWEGSDDPPYGVKSFGPMAGLTFDLVQNAQLINGSDISQLVGVQDQGALIAQVRARPLFVVADPDLLNNQALKNPDGARRAVQVLLRFANVSEGDGSITFALGLSAIDTSRSLIRTMFEPPFLAMTLALLVAALLAALHGATRFGPPRRAERAIPFGKAALVENSAGLVRLAGRQVTVGSAYADVARDDAARAGAAPTHLQGEELERYLDRFTRPGEAPFSALAQDVRAAQNRIDLLGAAQRLFRWKKDMIR